MSWIGVAFDILFPLDPLFRFFVVSEKKNKNIFWQKSIAVAAVCERSLARCTHNGSTYTVPFRLPMIKIDRVPRNLKTAYERRQNMRQIYHVLMTVKWFFNVLCSFILDMYNV